MSARLASFARLAVLVAAAGCGGPPVQPWSPATDATTSPRWSTTLAAWTRRGEAYEAFEGRLFTTATCMGPALSSALLRERAAREAWSGARLEAALLADADRQRSTLSVLLGLTPQDARWDDAAPGGTLEMTLSVDGVDSPAGVVRKLSEDEIGDLIPYFTWLTPLHSAYMLEFAAPGDPTRVKLRVAGPPARVEMQWEVPR